MQILDVKLGLTCKTNDCHVWLNTFRETSCVRDRIFPLIELCKQNSSCTAQKRSTHLRHSEPLGNLAALRAWPQMARIEDVRGLHVSHTWLFHLDACVGSVLAPYDFVFNVQKRRGHRSCLEEGPCCLRGAFLDP